jgi:hypothetical protein
MGLQVRLCALEFSLLAICPCEVEVKVTLRLTASKSVCLGIEHFCGTCDQILPPVGRFLSESCGLVSVGCPLWREDGSAVCNAITQCSESRRTRNQTLLSHLRLPQLGGPGSCIYIPQEQGGPVIPPGTGLLAKRKLWKYIQFFVTTATHFWALTHCMRLSYVVVMNKWVAFHISVSCLFSEFWHEYWMNVIYNE